MKFKSIIVIFFIIFISKGLFSITPPIICERQSPYDSAEVNISCDRFDFSELKFYRAQFVDGIYSNFRKNIPASDNCVSPGEYFYILDSPCPECGSGGYSSCMNYLTVVVKDHSEECEESGETSEVNSEDFGSYKSEWDYYEDCCESDLSAERMEIDFGKVKIGYESKIETIELSVYSCSCAPNDLTPSFSFKNEDQNVFEVEVGETNYSYIPSGSGDAEFLFSFSPEFEKEYLEVVVFDFDSIKLEVTLKGQGVKEENPKLDDEINDENSDEKTDDISQETNDPDQIPEASLIDDEVSDENLNSDSVAGDDACSIILI